MNNPSDVCETEVLEKDFFTCLEQLKNGFAIYDKDLNLIYANKAARSYLPVLYANFDAGMSFVKCVDLQIRDFYPDMNFHECRERAAKIVQAIRSEATIEVTASNGRVIKSEYKKMENGQYVIVSTDITESVRNEKALAQARKDAESADQAKTQFLANMSHEIRTPLSGVFMATQLLQKKLCNLHHPQLSELADVLAYSADHLRGVVNNVLYLSKIEAGQIEITPTENALAVMLENLKISQAQVAKNAGVDLILVIDPNLPERLTYDIGRVRQCVLNLVSNALKFTTAGSVTIAALFDPQTYIVKIHVVDTGPGIASHEHEQVFDHFRQVEEQASKPLNGTGLGLPISRKLAQLMGGDIVLTSELGKGAIFTLTFACEHAYVGSEDLAAVA